MIGKNVTVEKDINLQIAQKLQAYLELGGAYVIVTRDSDEAVGESKREDLKYRQLVSEDADAFISIHQNSFPSRKVRGAQVFYFDGSERSKRLAECVQEQVGAYLDRDNKRVAKANKDYYLLRRTTVPSVIVECGFLSNADEGRLLTTDEYQDRIAWTVYMGVINYFNE